MPRNTLIKKTFPAADRDCTLHNPLGLKGDQHLISPYNLDTLSSRIKKKSSTKEIVWMHHQILTASISRNLWQKLWRIHF